MKDLKQKALRSGLAKLCSQAADFTLRLGSLVILARLLDPKDFGLVAMVTAVTGLYGLFVNAGLSEATVQAPAVNNDQLSTLFWINIAIGLGLASACLLSAPILVKFYHEPRLFRLTEIVGLGFVLNASAVQHSALLQRQMRYITLAIIEITSQSASFATGVTMAVHGFGYWSLVGATLAFPATYTVCVWRATRWIPGLPRRNVGIHSMLRYGGTLTLNTFIVYTAYNVEKVLLGRFWGPDVLGLYGRAYQLINTPTGNLNSAVGNVIFSALSRLQDQPARFRNYFLKGYTLVNSITIPFTAFCALFSDDIILVFLGAKWAGAAPIFRLLTPTVLTFGMINPLAWLLLSLGLYGRSFRIALVLCPLVITAFAIGLPFGATGVAFAYSAVMILWLIPHVMWSVHGTPISPKDLVFALSKPLLSALAAAALLFVVKSYLAQLASPLLRIALGGSVMAVAYSFFLLFVAGETTLYLELFRGLKTPSSADR